MLFIWSIWIERRHFWIAVSPARHSPTWRSYGSILFFCSPAMNTEERCLCPQGNRGEKEGANPLYSAAVGAFLRERAFFIPAALFLIAKPPGICRGFLCMPSRGIAPPHQSSPREESNLYYKLRKLAFYPLNDEEAIGVGACLYFKIRNLMSVSPSRQICPPQIPGAFLYAHHGVFAKMPVKAKQLAFAR